MAEYNDYQQIKRSVAPKTTGQTKKVVKKATPSKTIVTPGTKVSQGTIDKIKSMGMSAALKSANSASPEMREGIRRMYGAARYNKAVGSKAAAPKPTDSRFSGTSVAKPKTATRAGSMDYTPGSAKSNKSAYTTGSGVRYASSTPKKAAPAQKTKDIKKNPLVKFVTSRVGGKSGGK
jgi:hypothetical protein